MHESFALDLILPDEFDAKKRNGLPPLSKMHAVFPYPPDGAVANWLSPLAPDIAIVQINSIPIAFHLPG
jgi:hypothetical protein